MEWVTRFTDLGYRVIRFDNRDIGLSEKMPEPPPPMWRLVASVFFPKLAKSSYRLNDMADDAVGLLDHLGVERAHVVGVSMGGMIAQSIAIGHPDRVASLTSIMSNTGDRRNGRPHWKLFTRFAKGIPHTPEEAAENGLETFQAISGPHFDEAEVRELGRMALERNFDGDGTARQTMAIAASPDRTDALVDVTAPTLVIHGLVDPLVMPSGGIATAKAVPGARLLMFPDMGHDLPRVYWDEIVDAIVANTRRAPTTSPAPTSASA
ncbi:alpha/beta hydrolase [soil metagenome]